MNITLKNDYYKDLSNSLKAKLTDQYGAPDEKLTGDGRYATARYSWWSGNMTAVLTVYQELGNGYLRFTYVPISEKAQQSLKRGR